MVWVGIGFGKTVLESFFELLTDKQKANIKAASGDGAGWIKETVEVNCPNAIFCIDPFHVVSWVTDALDQVRKEEWNDARKKLSEEKKLIKAGKAEQKDSSETEQLIKTIKSSKYSLLMNPEHLSENYNAKLDMILLHDRRLATAYRLKEELRLMFKLPPEEVPTAIDKWRRRAWSCRIQQFVELQRKIKRHKKAIIAAITRGLSNARIEATNDKIKLSIRMAYGFRNLDNLKAMIMLRCSGIMVSLPGRAA